ncbi:MAG: hypothetical protein GXP35_09030 [Actinobacteria bacterium]|nr:hypothetical protein [Actinomycetota bacterium]
MTADYRREWLSFDDPHELRTWMFDATFLASNYMCIYGQGCLGIGVEADADSGTGCCSHGAYFSDEDDRKLVSDSAKRLLTAENWQFHAKFAAKPFEKVNKSWKTKTVDGACIFQNRPDFHTGAGCALHSAAAEQGEVPAGAKPEVCWQIPIRREDHETETGHLFTMVREWARRDWGNGGDEFDWWCTDDDRAHVAPEPAYITLADELVRICGEEVYELLVTEMQARVDAAAVGVVFLPHPAVRPSANPTD